MPRVPPSATSTKSSIADAVPLIPVKEETRDLVVTEPRYNDGVLEGMWRDRRVEKTKQSLPAFRACSIYTSSFKAHPQEAYVDDEPSQAAWEHKASAEGLHRAILMEASGPKCRENFTTTTDLMHHWMPQACAQGRAFNSRHLEWLPAQDMLPCLGNLTQHGLKESMAARWASERAEERATLVTTHHTQFHKPCDSHRETSRKAVCRVFSSKLQSNNKILNDQHLRGKQILVVPNVLQGVYPVDVRRERLPIVPELPPEGPADQRVPDRCAGPHPFPPCCTGGRRCRRLPVGTPSRAPARPFYIEPCPARP